MSVEQPPIYYFQNIDFNSSFYDPENTGLTQTQANALYLRKTTPDTASAIETFAGGVLTDTINSITAGNNLTIASNHTAEDLFIGQNITSGDIYIGVNASATTGRSGTIHIGDGNNIAGGTVHINNGTNNASNTGINNGTTTTGIVNIMSGNTSTGTINLGTGTGSTTVNIGSGSTTGAIAIGNTANVTTIAGTVKASTITTPTTAGALTIAGDHIASGTVNIGSSVSTTRINGLIKASAITSISTSGTLTIGAEQIAGGTVNMGSTTSLTNLNGKTNIGGGDNFPSAMVNLTTQNNAKRDGIAIRSSAQNSLYYMTFLNQANTVCGRIEGNTGNSVAYETLSDRRMKKDISMMEGMIDKIMALKPSTYKWISNDVQSDGFISQEVYEVFPQMRSKASNSCNNIDEPCDKDTGEPIYYGVDYGRFTPYIVKAIQEIKQDYETKLSKLEERILVLEK